MKNCKNGILSKKMGAEYVEAIDIDSWAKENTEENAQENNVCLNIKQGGAEKISKDNVIEEQTPEEDEEIDELYEKKEFSLKNEEISVDIDKIRLFFYLQAI